MDELWQFYGGPLDGAEGPQPPDAETIFAVWYPTGGSPANYRIGRDRRRYDYVGHGMQINPLRLTEFRVGTPPE